MLSVTKHLPLLNLLCHSQILNLKFQILIPPAGGFLIIFSPGTCAGVDKTTLLPRLHFPRPLPALRIFTRKRVIPTKFIRLGEAGIHLVILNITKNLLKIVIARPLPATSFGSQIPSTVTMIPAVLFCFDQRFQIEKMTLGHSFS